MPMVGLRYRCSVCPNHDLCETCYEEWKTQDVVPNGLGRKTISKDPKDHEFRLFKDRGFHPIRRANAPVQQLRTGSKIKPNDTCPKCDSGKKYKKCCGK